MPVLVFADWYLPGFKAGGPIRSIANMVEALGDEFQFKVITRDRDWLQTKPYENAVPGVWQPVGKAEVIYLTPRDLAWRNLSRVIRAVNPDILYFNSLFSPRFSILPLTLRRLGRIGKAPVILAPRGELSPNALSLKKAKKRLTLQATRSMGLYDQIVWQASTLHEASSIRSAFGDNIRVMIAPNIPAQASVLNHQASRERKVAGRLKILFLSRISRMKNLDGALTMLQGIDGDLHFDIYGPLEQKDQQYWVECQKIISGLPPNIKVTYCGDIEHSKVTRVMKEHDLFFLPTLGENFGHVVPESLLNGCPVLISDRTPWQGLEEKGVGWVFPLSEPERFRRVIQGCVRMGPLDHTRLSDAAATVGREIAADSSVIQQTRDLLNCALSRRDGKAFAQHRVEVR
jgi:glycosyltransferase involved in cell wall biosynthesis